MHLPLFASTFQWEPFTDPLPPGRYRFLNAGTRYDTEIFFEKCAPAPFNAPYVVRYDPPNDAVIPTKRGWLQLWFDQPMIAWFGLVYVWHSNGTLLETVSVSDATKVYIQIDSNTVRIPLSASTTDMVNTTFYVTIDEGAFRSVTSPFVFVDRVSMR